MRGRREPRGQPHFVLPPNLYMGPPVGGLFGFKLSTLAGHRRLRAERSTSAFCSIWRRTGSRRLGLWERTARTEILEQSTSASRILSADVADAIEALGRVLINAQMSGLRGSIHRTCLSALVTDRAMGAWYHPSPLHE